MATTEAQAEATEAIEAGPGISGLVEDASKRRHHLAIGIGALVGGASFLYLNKRMATNRAIIVGLVLSVVSYAGAKMYLPTATAQNYGN